MILPRLHDRLLLGGTLAGATGILLSRMGSGAVSSAGLVLAGAGIVLVLLGTVMKIRKGR